MRLDAVLSKLIAASVDHGEAASDEPRAAVAAILREPPHADRGAELFFIRRAEQPNDPWSGHIAFPGGRREPDDKSLLETAIRETREEVGIDLQIGDVVARLPDVTAFVRSKRGQLVVSVFVFVLHRDVDPIPNDEVATTFWVPLALLQEGAGKSTFELEYDGKKYELPYIYLQPGEHRLWGMTYEMLMSLLDAVN